MAKRASGILLHITSLPSPFGVGDLGPESYRFVDALAAAKQHYWSILPLSPTSLEDGNSPYQTSSAFAGNTLLISPELLVQDGLLPKDAKITPISDADKADYKTAYTQKAALLEQAYLLFEKTQVAADRFQEFCQDNKSWLDDYALYIALRTASGKPWHLWSTPLRKRNVEALARKSQTLKEKVKREKFAQFLFFSQWQKLKAYCRAKQISVVGDMSFYVSYDSADIWVHPELFNLNANGKTRFVGGVPPDYFSANGQLWGNPTYNWQKLAETDFAWWITRISHNLTLYDKLRLDHFRGFVAYWQVPAKAKTAKNGKWVKTPSDTFFGKLKTAFPMLPFVAEDLGDIDQPVREAIKRLGIPGMRVLLFGFNGDKGNPHHPKNHTSNSVVYTGTHDTNTVRGWFTKESTAKERQNLFKLVGRKVSAEEVSFEVAKLALSSVAELSVIPLQDVLGLGADARMNNPSVATGNWQWRATPHQLESDCLDKLCLATERFNRG